MDILWKGVLGGLITAMIAWFSRRGSLLPGILPLCPVFAIIAFYLVGSSHGTDGVRQAATAGMMTLPAYFAFLLVCIVAVRRVDFRVALVLGLLVWLIVALGVFFCRKPA